KQARISEVQIDEGEGLLTPAILDELQKIGKFFYIYNINLLENGGYGMTMELEKVKSIAERCTHFGMCKIDFLGTGVCPSGIEHKYVSYYPHGRMEVVNALANNLIPVTERLVDIARSCTLCGICDKQCYFLMELRPMKVMEALKEYIESYIEKNKPIERPEEDAILQNLRAVVGSEWATNDPAILIAYSRARFPVSPRRIPKYVVMPVSTQEVVEIIKIANEYRVPYVPRGTGTSTNGALCEGIVIDLNRMKTLEIDPENWSATIGGGITAFELQREAFEHRMRANVAEPAACVCANIICTNLHSFFSHAYGMGADHYIDAEIVSEEGKVFRLNEKDAPNLFSFNPPPPGSLAPSPGICTQITVKLYPVMEDEEGILIPFSDFREALAMAREVSKRRIGIAAGILGSKYLSVFPAPTFKVSEEVEHVLKDQIGVEYILMVLGDKYAMKTIKEMADVTWDQKRIKTLLLGLPRLSGIDEIELLSQFSEGKELYKMMFTEEMEPIVEMILSPSPDNIAEAVDEDMKDFFSEVYTKPEMTDLVWLNMFRILPVRQGRNHAPAARVLWCPMDNLDRIVEICGTLKSIGDKYNLRNAFGYLVPVDFGKRAVMEYTYFFDQTDDQERENAKNAAIESMEKVSTLMQEVKGLRSGVQVLFQGLSRRENFLYT
ncbi:MAG: FAD-binding protein, partial [Proteobacteria bacterium]|nr:FAD-binding protein [Pseudomonadota bacterium]